MTPLTVDLPIRISLIAVERDYVVQHAYGVASTGCCPTCGALSYRVHDRYPRRPFDQPWREWTVRLQLTVRRFRCGNTTCSRSTIVEDFGSAMQRRAQRTATCTRLLTAVACALGDEAGARLTGASGVPTSPTTLLRLERQVEERAVLMPRILGVDDFALCQRHTYGTILIDLERDHSIALLKRRTYRARPCRSLAEGARQGAQQAFQSATTQE